MIKSANTHRRKVDVGKDDYVWLNIKCWNTARPSLKLDSKNSGPFKIIEKKGNSFRLELPASMKRKYTQSYQPINYGNQLTIHCPARLMSLSSQ
jgi:hypothetical protein